MTRVPESAVKRRVPHFIATGPPNTESRRDDSLMPSPNIRNVQTDCRARKKYNRQRGLQ